MNQLIKNNLNKMISIFILLQPILDLITGLSIHLLNLNLTIGIIIRILFLALIMYITVFVYHKKKSFYIYCVILLYSILYLLGIILYKNGVGIFQEIQGLVRVFYFPLLLISLYELKDEIRINKLTLFMTLILYLILIFIPLVLGVGFKSYQITKVGTLGFFNSANEISGIISILTPIMFIIFKELKNTTLKVLVTLIYLVVILTIGTKTPLLSLVITIGATLVWLIIKCTKEKRYKSILFSFIFLIIAVSSLIVIIPKTNFYKNIKTHMNYLKVDDLGDVFEDEELVDHFIFSQRLTFLEKKAKIYNNSSLYQQVFGIGYLKNNKTTKMIEMDYFDIYYSHGIIGFIIFFSIYIYILFNILKEKQKITFDGYMLIISLLLILALSLFTGHIITAPAVSILVIIIIISLAKRTKKDLLFAAYNLEIGGIEMALLNLLNNINYDKYKVEVILEEKKGTLLKKVNSNVKVTELKVSTNKNIFIRKITNMIRKINFALLNYHNYDFSCCYATYSLSANKITKIASTNTSIYIHSNYKDLYQDEQKEKEFFDKRKISEFKKIIFVSNESKNDFLRLYKNLKSKSVVLNNFIDITSIKEKSKESIIEKKDISKKLFVFIGRLDDSSKKLSRAINLVKELKDINLWIVGDGPDRKKYEEETLKYKLTNRIKFIGRKENPYPYMNKADYIILTSDYEGFPVTYLEAIVLNKPIITTIDVSDDKINIGKDYAYIISKDQNKMVKEVKNILTNNKSKKKIDLDKAQTERIKELERIFDEVV